MQKQTFSHKWKVIRIQLPQYEQEDVSGPMTRSEADMESARLNLVNTEKNVIYQVTKAT